MFLKDNFIVIAWEQFFVGVLECQFGNFKRKLVEETDSILHLGQTKLALSKSMEYGGNSITCVISSCAVTLDGNMFSSEVSMSCDGVVVMLVFPVGHSLVFKLFNLYTSLF